MASPTVKKNPCAGGVVDRMLLFITRPPNDDDETDSDADSVCGVLVSLERTSLYAISMHGGMSMHGLPRQAELDYILPDDERLKPRLMRMDGEEASVHFFMQVGSGVNALQLQSAMHVFWQDLAAGGFSDDAYVDLVHKYDSRLAAGYEPKLQGEDTWKRCPEHPVDHILDILSTSTGDHPIKRVQK